MTHDPSVTLDAHEFNSAMESIPRLEYSLRTRKLRIGIFWGLIFVDSVALPVLLYFVLWYGTDLDHNTGKY